MPRLAIWSIQKSLDMQRSGRKSAPFFDAHKAHRSRRKRTDLCAFREFMLAFGTVLWYNNCVKNIKKLVVSRRFPSQVIRVRGGSRKPQ